MSKRKLGRNTTIANKNRLKKKGNRQTSNGVWLSKKTKRKQQRKSRKANR